MSNQTILSPEELYYWVSKKIEGITSNENITLIRERDMAILEQAYYAGVKQGKWLVTYTGPNHVPPEAPPSLDETIHGIIGDKNE
jgi:hypothetical protein